MTTNTEGRIKQTSRCECGCTRRRHVKHTRDGVTSHTACLDCACRMFVPAEVGWDGLLIPVTL